jgi:hypothetical protein
MDKIDNLLGEDCTQMGCLLHKSCYNIAMGRASRRLNTLVVRGLTSDKMQCLESAIWCDKYQALFVIDFHRQI